MENNGPPSDATAARRILEQVHADRARVSSALRAPLWYRVGLALVVASFIGAFALDEDAFTVAVSVSAVAAVLLGAVRPWVTKTQADPWNDEASLRIGLAQSAAVLVVGAAGIALFTATGLGWVLWLAAVLAGALCFGLSTWMETVFARSMRQSRR